MNDLVLNNDRYFGVKSVLPLFYDEIKEKPMKKGIATVSLFEFNDREDPIFNLRAVRDGGWMFRVRNGHYTRLHINGELTMSDTGLERISNEAFIKKANGRVLIAGLGLGLIIYNILEKDNISEIVVIEKFQDVIDLVGAKINNPKLRFINADIFDWKPNREEKFDIIYFDIWTDINTENLSEIRILHNRFKSFLNRSNPNRYMNSWMKEFLQARKRNENRYSY